MNLTYFYFCCLAIIINLVIFSLSFAYRKKKSVKDFMFATFLAIVALGFYSASLVITDTRIKLFIHEVKFLGTAFFSVGYFLLYMNFLGKEKLTNKRNIILLSIIPAVSVIMALTNEYHHLFRIELYVLDNKYGSFIGVSSGIYFWFYIVYSYIIYFWGVSIAVREYLATPRVFRMQTGIMVSAAVVTIAINFISISGLVFEDFGDATLFSFTIAIIIQFYGLVLYKPTRAIDSARSMAVNEIRSPIIVFDYTNMFMDANLAAAELFNDAAGGKEALENYDIRSFFENKLGISIEGSKPKHEFETKISDRFFTGKFREAVDEAGKYLGATILLNDVTQLKNKEAILTEVSTRDLLTGIPNRNAYMQRLAVIKDGDMPVVLAHFNISGMNEINKNIGNDAGDNCIKKTAGIISEVAEQKGAFCARTGGDEFALVLCKTSEETAADIVDEIKGLMGDVVLISGIASKRTSLDNISLIERQALLDLSKNRVIYKANPQR